MEKKIVLFIVIGSVLFFTSCTNTEKEEILEFENEIDIKEMARKAVDNLIDKIKGIKGRESVSIIEGHLVEKDSVKNLVL